MPLPVFRPLPLTRRPKPFSGAEWLFEIKHDGFRALCYIERGQARLVSRNGNQFASFSELCEHIAKLMHNASAILDGEIVCTDENGCAQFNELLFRRGVPRFFTFDLLWLDGRDLRDITLIERKRALRSLLQRQSDHLLYVDYVEGQGERLFDLVCERDLEGIVAKHRFSRYAEETDSPSWIKIRNRNYSQMVGCDELFERKHEAQGAPEFGWNVCAKAASNAA